MEAGRSHLALHADRFECDVTSLLATTRYGEPELKLKLCEGAVNAVGGTFLANLDDEWIRDERARLSLVYVKALLTLADGLVSHSPEQALAYAERAIMEEPLLDGARVRKISALVRMGEVAAAQLEYEAFAELLDQELGITPSDSVRNALNEQSVVVRRSFVPDRPNVSTDLSFALDTLGLGDRPEQAIDLAIAAVPHWIEVGTPGLGIEKLQEALDRTRSRLSDAKQAHCRVCLAELSLAKGDVQAAEEILKDLRQKRTALTEQAHFQSLLVQAWIYLSRLDGKTAASRAKAAAQIAETCGELSMKCEALSVKATAELYAPNLEQAMADADAAFSLAKMLGHKMTAGASLLIKAQIQEADGNLEDAEENIRQGLQIIDGIQSPRASRHRLSSARLMENLGRLAEAEAGYRRALTELQGFESRFLEAVALTYLGDLVLSTGRPREAVALQSRAVSVRRELNQGLGLATSLRGLGKAYTELGEFHAARESLLESAHLFLNEDAMPGYASSLLALAVVEENCSRQAYAVSLAKRARKLLRGMTLHERRSIGRSGLTAADEATALIARCA
jgi:tetratricopeptide (TPR) repeat protein